MKELADGTFVLARMYYYLLDFNDTTNREYIKNILDKNALQELNNDEFSQLFQHAITVDLQNYCHNFKNEDEIKSDISCENCRFNKPKTYHDQMWCRDCRQKHHFEQINI